MNPNRSRAKIKFTFHPYFSIIHSRNVKRAAYRCALKYLAPKEVRKIKSLLVIRHGSYDFKGLTDYGIEDVKKLTAMLSKVINPGESTIMISSPIDRAILTAEIISEGLDNLPFRTHSALCESKSAPESTSDLSNLSGALELVRELSDEFSTIIFVSHEGCASCLPMYYSVYELGLPQKPFNYVGKGSGQVLDCTTGTISYLSPHWDYIK